MIYTEVLTASGLKIKPYLAGFKNFYLAGGTAIALQIGHRISIDYDFFSEEKIPQGLLSRIKKNFPENFHIEVLVNNSDELTFIAEKTKVTFLYYPFPILAGLTDLDGIASLSLKELAATKAYTIGRRGTFKDYTDIFFLLKEKHTDLPEIIGLATKKYQSDFI